MEAFGHSGLFGVGMKSRRQLVQILAGAAALVLVSVAGTLYFASGEEEPQVVPVETTLELPTVEEVEETIVLEEAPRPQTAEEKRFARWDRNDDGRISLDEYLHNRRRNFDRLDDNKDGVLSFEEYAKAGIDKFKGADKDRSGFLNSDEFATLAPKPRKKPAATKMCPCPSS